jgi:hypothetical protein
MPRMTERFVAALNRNPQLAAVTCFLVGFRQPDDIPARRFAFEYCPTGGPHIMASFENVYGDTNAVFRTGHLRAVGGYETDRSTPWEDWETFVKLVNHGYQVDVVPELLFYYRVRDDSRLREMTLGWTDLYRPNQHLLRSCFFTLDRLPLCEKAALWNAFVSFQKRTALLGQQLAETHHDIACRHQHTRHIEAELERHVRHARDLEEHLRHHQKHIARLEHDLNHHEYTAGQLRALNHALLTRQDAARHRFVEKLNAKIKKVPLVHGTMRASLMLTWKAWKGLRTPARVWRRLRGGEEAVTLHE